MENPGAVIFSEDFVFRSRVTDDKRRRRAMVLAHEMSHMWFGDLVTMRWWDDLWLNESFAELMGFLTVDRATRFDGAWVDFSTSRKAWGYRADQLPSTHPVQGDVVDNRSALLNFDGISYAKGASVLRQLMATVGEDVFFTGVRAYLDRHAFANTSFADLLVALEVASGQDLGAWAQAWLQTSGVSTLRTAVGPAIEIRQEGGLRPHRIGVGLYHQWPARRRPPGRAASLRRRAARRPRPCPARPGRFESEARLQQEVGRTGHERERLASNAPGHLGEHCGKWLCCGAWCGCLRLLTGGLGMFGALGRSAGLGLLSLAVSVSVQGGLVAFSAPPAVAAGPSPVGIGEPNRAAAAAAAPVAVASVPTEPAGPVSAPRPVPPVSPLERTRAKAKAQGSPVVVEELTSERSRTTALADGTFDTEVSTEPVRFRDATGVWRPLDLELVTDGDRLRPRAAGPSAARLVRTTGSAPAVEVGEGARVFSWRLEGMAAGRSAQVSGPGGPGAAARVRYAGALPGGRDLQLQVQGERVKESVLLPDRAVALAFPSYTDVFTVPVGVRARQGERGVEFIDPLGVLVAGFGGGHAFDSGRDEVGEPATAAVSTSLVAQAGRSVTVSVGVDAGWLADPARVFPVTVDPDFYTNSSIDWGQDAYVDAAYPTTAEGSYDSGRLKTGFRSVNGANQPSETLVQFGLPPELTDFDNNVLWSQLSMFNEYSSSCDRTDMPPVVLRSNAQPWDARSVTWDTRPPVWDPWTSRKFAFGYNSTCGANWADMDVRPQVQEWSLGRPNYGLRLWVESGLTFGYKRFQPAELGWGAAPHLRVNWENCTTVHGGPNGPRKVCGEIRDRWWALGGTGWGFPTTDDARLPDGGYFNHFALNGVEDRSVYWHPQTGAHGIQGSIRQRWAELGWEWGLGYPVTDQRPLPDGQGWYNHFFKPGAPASPSADGLHNSIYWHPEFGAHDVQGPLRARWSALGWEWGLGYPVTGQSYIGDVGRFNDFRKPGSPTVNSLTWTAATGAHDTWDKIRLAWGSQDFERGWLGYPTTGQVPVAGGARNEFEGGNIVRDDRAGTTTLGAGVLTYPTQFQKVTQRRTQLQATARQLSRAGAPVYDAVKFQWRSYDLSVADGWADVPSGDLSVNGSSPPAGWLPVTEQATADGPGKASATYVWNATSTIAADGLVQVRGCFRLADGSSRCTSVNQITVDRAGLTGANASGQVGPGTVGLLTGAYALTGRDAEVAAPYGGLAVSRTLISNDSRSGPLGTGWRMSLAVDEAGADYAELIDGADAALVVRGDGTQLPFVRVSAAPADANSYTGDGEAAVEGHKLTFVPGPAGTASEYQLVDLDGDTVIFRRSDGGNGHSPGARFRVVRVVAVRGTSAGGPGSALTEVLYTAGGNPRVLLAPQDTGVACGDPTVAAQPAGCRALEFRYTGTGSAERLSQIRLRATGAAAGAGALVDAASPVGPQDIQLAGYSYDSNGRLASVTDPRSGLAVGYSYAASGRVSEARPPGGGAAWTFSYDAQSMPRLTGAVLDDTPDTGLPAQRSTVVYDLPLDGSRPALPTLTATEVGRWAQTTVPTDLSAVFGPDTVPTGNPVTVGTVTDAQWRGAQLSALDVNGRPVNTASYGGTADQDTGADQSPGWRIGTSEYDTAGRGNTVRSLSAANRERALAASPTGDVAVQQAQAIRLDSRNVFSADGKDLLRAYGPARQARHSTGPAPAQLPFVRSRTVTAYDTGNEPGHPTPGVSRRLPVSSTVDAVLMDGLTAGLDGTDPGLPAFDGQRVSRSEYGTANAWLFGSPTATISNPGGGAADITTRQAVDEQGRTVSRTLPAGGTSTTTAATTTKSYYAASHPDSQCANAAWAGWLCKSSPGGLPSAGFAVPTTWVDRYDVYGTALRTVETAADGLSRTSTSSYDPAERVRRVGSTGTGTEAGVARPDTETSYDSAGRLALTRLVTGGSTADGTGPIARSYDAYGRISSYTDGTGLVTTSTYDSAGRPATVSNSHGSRTVSYEANGERGSLPTALNVSGVGVFTARYGADGTVVRQTLPGELTATTITDAAGAAVSLAYTKPGVAGDWLRSTATMTGFDQVDGYTNLTATGTGGTSNGTTSRYGYDNLGRLSTVVDTAAGGTATCTRAYTLNANSNRTALTQTASAGAPTNTCPGSINPTDSYSYDTADRLLAGPAGSPRASLRYDRLGRTRTLPSADTVDRGGDLGLDFYHDDLVASISQNGRSSTFGLDPASRRVLRTDSTTNPATSSRTLSHYTADDDNPDSVTEPGGSITRNVTGLGPLAAIATGSPTAPTVTLQLANLHGDIAATLPVGATSPSQLTVSETTEYGLPRTQPAAGSLLPRYGWLGTHQRDTSTPGGLTLMGVRLYTPTLGRFLSVDPVEGGSANNYDYANADPTNTLDLDGRCVPCAIGGGAGAAVAAAAAAAAAVAVLQQYCKLAPCTVALPKVGMPTIPKAGKSKNNEGKRYYGYTISTANGQVWKYGIGSTSIRMRVSQLKCGRTCSARKSWSGVGYYNARKWEVRMISAYAKQHKHCPPGQLKSCK